MAIELSASFKYQSRINVAILREIGIEFCIRRLFTG